MQLAKEFFSETNTEAAGACKCKINACTKFRSSYAFLKTQTSASKYYNEGCPSPGGRLVSVSFHWNVSPCIKVQSKHTCMRVNPRACGTYLPLAHIYATVSGKIGYYSRNQLETRWPATAWEVACAFSTAALRRQLVLGMRRWGHQSPLTNCAWAPPYQDGIKKDPLSDWFPIFQQKIKANENRDWGRWWWSSKIENSALACCGHLVMACSVQQKKKVEG